MRQRALLHGLAVLAVLAGAYMFFVLCPSIIYTFGFDAHSYWGFPRGDLYSGTAAANGMGIYRYAPVFAPPLDLLSRLDWSTFAVLWLALLVATSMWLAGRWWLLALAFPPLIFELYLGNIHLLLAAAIVIGFRYPVTWSFVLLTKVTAAVVVRGLLLAPATCLAWFGSLVGTADAAGTNHVPIPLVDPAWATCSPAARLRRWLASA